MESHVLCQSCREKNSINFSYCWKCGGKLYLEKKKGPKAQEVDLSLRPEEEADTDFIEKEKVVRPISNNVIPQESSTTLSEPLEIDQKSIVSNKEVEKWRKWFSQQTDKYLELKINKNIFKNMFGSYTKFLQENNIKFLTSFEDLLADLEKTTFVYTVLKNNRGYKITEMNKKGYTSVTREKRNLFKVQESNGSSLGEIKGNLTGSKWKIIGHSEENQATVKFNFKKQKKGGSYESVLAGRIETPFGNLIAGGKMKKIRTSVEGELWNENIKGHFVATECNIKDSDGNHCFSVKCVDQKLNKAQKTGKEYRIVCDPQQLSNPFLITSISVCLIEKYIGKIESYREGPERVVPKTKFRIT